MQAWYDDAELLSKWADPETTSHTAGFHDSAVNYTAYSYRLAPESCVVGWAKLDAIIESALDSVWLGEATAQDALTEISTPGQCAGGGLHHLQMIRFSPPAGNGQRAFSRCPFPHPGR